MRRQARASARPMSPSTRHAACPQGARAHGDADPHGRRRTVVLRAAATVEPYAPAARLLVSFGGQTSGRGRGIVPRG
jgi:hypothetical protein